MTVATRNPSVFNIFNREFDKYLIGFDNQWNRLSNIQDDITKNASGYPPYNIFKADEANYEIQMAVSGFSESDISITFEDGKLTIEGKATDPADTSFIYKGIASRSFTRAFALNDQMDVKGAELTNGMLKIYLEYLIPDHKKPRKIAIGADKPEPVLLTE